MLNKAMVMQRSFDLAGGDIFPYRQSAGMRSYTPHHKRTRVEAFEWYLGRPPSPEVARRHFVEKAKKDPQNLLLYEEALRLFIATCWRMKQPG